MPTHPASSASGFTLLEVCLAMLIAVLVVTVAVPALAGLLGGKKERASFEAFDALVRQAHARSVEEKRPYVLVWSRRRVVARADQFGQTGEVGHLEWKDGERLTLDLPAALRKDPPAVWTFWPGGACEPATVSFRGGGTAWTARYDPFTAEAAVDYE